MKERGQPQRRERARGVAAEIVRKRKGEVEKRQEKKKFERGRL